MSKTKRKFLYFSTGDFKGVQKYLDDLAAQGWELVSTDHLLTGEFVPTNRTELTYYVDLVPPKEPEEERRSYLRLCEDAGWELVGTTNQMRIFKSQPCRHPVPVQTDGELEAGNFRRYTIRRLVSSFLCLLLVLGLNLLPALAINGSDRLVGELRDAVVHGWYVSWFVDACLVILPLLLIGSLFRAAEQSAMAVWCRRSVRKLGVLPTPPKAVMYLHSGWMLLCLLSLMVIWCACAADGLSGGKLFVCYLWCGIWISYLLLEVFVGLGEREYTRGQKKEMLRMIALLAACLVMLVLLDWKGPWQHYDSAAMSSSVDVEAEPWLPGLEGKPILRGRELGLDRNLFSVKYENGTSLFTRWWVYREDSIGNGPMESRYYECLTEETARRVTADLVEQTENGITWKHLVFRAGLDMVSMDRADMDECWYGHTETDGQVSGVLVFRNGKTVALVSAPTGLMTEEHLETMRKAFGI